MKNLKMFTHILILFIIIQRGCMCAPKTVIEGVRQICRDQQQRLGRCIAPKRCYSSIKPWNSTMCSSDQVCCALGPGIVYPDDNDEQIQRIPAMQRNLRNKTKSSAGRILFPDDNGNFNIPGQMTAAPAVVHFVSNSIETSETATAGPTKSNVSIPNTTDGPDDRLGGSIADLRFPKPRVCGPIVVGHKIHGGTEAELGEFPWLVNLEYRTVNNTLEIACAGNIINHRYILTAGHCVAGPIEEEVGILESVRVGDHNTEKSTDCDENGCIDPYERFMIIRKIVHDKFFMAANRRMFNDIALLKTDRDMKYSFSVAPICMPNVVEGMPRLVTKVRLTVAGWGADGHVDFTDEKRIVDVPYIENDECSINVQDVQICAGGETGKDSCTGDSGGSLALLTQQGWVIVGIVSFGRKCGTELPAIYTRVSSYQSWIQQHVDAN